MLLTIGHSTHSLDHFIDLLHSHSVGVLVDIRSSPYSGQHAAQFNQPVLKSRLPRDNIAYVFEGAAMGARPDDPNLYRDGQLSFARVLGSEAFIAAFDRVVDRSNIERLVLMCSEKEPLDCPRSILIARAAVARGVSVAHILEDGSIEDHRLSEDRLIEETKQGTPDLFASPSEALANAYRIQESRIAFRREAFP